jgi:hypothetical protein
MTRIAILSAFVALAVPAAVAAQTTTPSPENSASAACKAERKAMGEATFKATYGTNRNKSNAFGKCVSKRTRSEQANASNAAKQCKAERADPNFAANHGGKTFAQFYGANKNGENAYGKCVSAKAKAASEAQTRANVNAAKKCKADRKADPAAFAAKWGTRRNAFGKCVSATAKAS